MTVQSFFDFIIKDFPAIGVSLTIACCLIPYYMFGLMSRLSELEKMVVKLQSLNTEIILDKES